MHPPTHRSLASKISRQLSKNSLAATAARLRALSRQRSSAIRRWASTQGIPIAVRGRIANSVVSQYAAAHP
ncbi:Lsr2 family DNA-binding protein [Nonomuraea sp. LPB2021202275-12-8]|uniref:Lsr2 family DNA-binding protein n=1 Tax=Nonomuraea sp. LPB2021202275-12-8 TaxID=3120159 RepID=UPI003FA53BD6